MSDAKAESRDRANSYLEQMLSMNPMVAGEEIVCTRAKALKLQPPAGPAIPHDTEQLQSRRREFLQRLADTREKFWSLTPEKLQVRLNRLDVGPYPDLAATVARLRTVASHRPDLARLYDRAELNRDFLNAFRQVLVAPSRDVAILKEQLLSKFRNRAFRKAGRRMVKILEQELPAIYELEADWLETLYRQKVELPEIIISSGSRDTSLTEKASGASPWVVWVVLFILFQIIKSLSQME